MASNFDRAKKVVSNESPELVAHLLADLMGEVERQRLLIEKIKTENAAKDQSAFEIEEKVKVLRRLMFDSGAERRTEATDRPRDKSQEEAFLFSQAAFPSPEVRDKQNAKSSVLDEPLVNHRMSAEALIAESRIRGFASCVSADWQDTGLFDESSKIQIIERRYVREKHRRFKYKYVGSESPDKEIIITASGADELLPGMNYTTEFVASVVADKYISHMPLERQTREMESLGLRGIKNSTLSKHCALAAASLERLQERILREDLLTSDLGLHIDETPWKIQNKHQKDGFMWVISNRYGAYYFYKPTRSGQVLKEKLIGYDGPVLTDGFSGYNVLQEIGIPQANCWAHARREFLPLESHDPGVKPILDQIDELFAVERRARSFSELKILRATESSVILDRLKELLSNERQTARDGSQKKKAIEYTVKRWDGLTMFISDTRLPLSNNEAERTIRHAVMGRKNYYGSGSHSGAATAATLFTIIESCKKNDIDPRGFILMCLQRVASTEELETPLAYARRTRHHAD